MKTYIYILGLVVSFVGLSQTPRPADPQSEPIAITGTTVHIGNGEVMENATVKFDEGKITFVGDASTSTEGHRVVDGSGKHLYPGIIMPSIRIGLEDISAVRPTRDYEEVGNVNPHIRSQIAFNTDSDILPTYRFNGILLAQVTPQGGLVAGTSSVMMLDGWNWEDATYLKDDAVHVNWPSKTFRPRWWLGETERRENKQYKTQVETLKQLIADSKSYAEIDGPEVNLKLKAMQGVLNGSNLFVNANAAQEIVEAISTLKGLGIENLVLTGGRDAFYVKDLLKEHGIPVVLDNIHRMPSREEEDVDFPFRLAGLLQKEGITVCLRHTGMLAGGRNLPFYAGTVAAYGVDKEEALKMITSNTANVLGIGDKTGTIEIGKDANMIISDGDLLDMKSSIISYAVIQGREVIIEGKQQVLYERFKGKYSGE